MIEKFCHISTGCIINGETIIGSGSFIGSGSVLVNNCKNKIKYFFKNGKYFEKMKIKTKIIAEVGVNHNGKLKALKLIDAAKFRC